MTTLALDHSGILDHKSIIIAPHHHPQYKYDSLEMASNWSWMGHSGLYPLPAICTKKTSSCRALSLFDFVWRCSLLRLNFTIDYRTKCFKHQSLQKPLVTECDKPQWSFYSLVETALTKPLRHDLHLLSSNSLLSWSLNVLT